MNKTKAILATLLSVALLLGSMAGISTFAAGPDADTVLNAPTLTGDTFTHSTEGKYTLTDGANGGIHVEANGATFSDFITSDTAYGFDGLHYRLENITFDNGEGDEAYNHINIWFSSQKKQKWVAFNFNEASGYYLDINLSNGNLRCLSNLIGRTGNEYTSMHSTSNGHAEIKDATTLDIKLGTKADCYDYVTNDGTTVESYGFYINGVFLPVVDVETATAWGAQYPLAFDNVYIGFNGCDPDTSTYESDFSFDLTVLHGGDETCHEGETDLETEDKDAQMNAPKADDTFTAKDGSGFTATANQDGSLKITGTNVGFADYFTSDKAYKFDGLHFRLDNLQLDPNYNSVNIWFSSNNTHAWTFGNFAARGYYLQINLVDGSLRCLSNLIGFCGANSYSVLPAADNAIKGATSLDIKLGTFDATNGKSYGFIINGVQLPVTELSTVDTWNGGVLAGDPMNWENAYIGFNGADANQASGFSFSYDLTVLHGGDAVCYEDVPAVLLEDVKKAEDALAEIAAKAEITLADEEAVAAARALYESLNATQKALMDTTNLGALAEAEETIAALKEQEALDKAAQVQNVIDLISAIPTEVTLDDEAAIVAAEEAYAALDEEQKDQITNFVDLTFARMALDALKEEAELGGGDDDDDDDQDNDQNQDEDQDQDNDQENDQDQDEDQDEDLNEEEEEEESKEEESEEEEEDIPQTGVSDLPVMISALVAMMAAAALVVLKKVRA